MIRKSRKIRLTYGLALATMATTLSALQAYADDPIQRMSDTRPPQIAPAANNAMPQTSSTNMTKILGTVQVSGDSTAAPQDTETGDVPLVAPMESTESWESILPPQQSGNVTYITGGIGDEERAALGEAKKNFNVYIMNSNKNGAFIGDARILIRASKGDVVLDTAAGPLLYAKLPAGTYTVEGSSGGQTQKEKIKIGTKGASNVGFSW